MVHRCSRRFHAFTAVAVVLGLLLGGVLFGGCSIVGPGDETHLVRVAATELRGPEKAAPGDTLAFTVEGFVLGASIEVTRQSDRQAELTAWAPERQPDAWCATPPLPQIGRFEARAPAEGTYVLRFRQPDSTVLEKKVEVVRE